MPVKRIGNLLRKALPAKKVDQSGDVEALRLDFKERYRNFKQLIAANNKALEIMADMERALQGGHPFGMTFVRSSVTAVSVNVYRMVKKLRLLAPGKYDDLDSRFVQIQQEINEILSSKKQIVDDRLVIPLNQINIQMADIVGGKMANLGEIKNKLGLRVPPGFVITSRAYERFIHHNDLRPEINRRLQSADLNDMQTLYSLNARLNRLIVEGEVPGDLAQAILSAWQATEAEAGFEITAAMRSSALGEDMEGSSFAGMHLSELNISRTHVLDAYKEILASKYSLQAITYRLKKGFKDEDIAMCVGVLVMVDAASGGVMYSRNPIDIHDDSIFINSAWGLPKAVVDGTIDCDLFVVARKAPMRIVHADIYDKERKFVCYPLEGVCRIDLTGETRNEPSLTSDQALQLAEIAVQLENHYGSPQDIEWAVGLDGRVYVLQCRPLQQTEVTRYEIPAALKRDTKAAVLASGGITASPGAACGPVFRVESGLDVLAFPQGAVLVARQALPSWASLISRAAAVITEHGSFAGHLANVSREFGVPALFGVSQAFASLQNDMRVTVDADGQTVYEGQVDDLLTETQKKVSWMEGSPVYETLQEISQRVIPLNLIDPASTQFAPRHCRTYHDITRFVHEKSVQEMFNFGREHNFSERSSKQLHYGVPMQWWILNLDDGFNTEIKGKYVKLKHIASIPMLAYWEGFTAVTWDGPPAIDGKGLMSVMFQSTANPALTPGRRSKFADQNYFMISKHFCNLNQRLGYHFSVMEALVGERKEENYIKFQFKGGAADVERRTRRIHFIADILTQFEFRAHVIEDNLEARIEGYDEEYMKKRVEILGYLSLHTRQIDMIMTNDAMVRYYHSKFVKDIEYLLNEHQRQFYN
jgi:pyruvate,water dikinase